MKVIENKARQDAGWLVFGLVLGLIAFVTTGCGVMGVREADLWGAKFTFAEGIDLHMGANQIDRVDDRRGVAPIRGQKNGAVPAAY